MFPPPMDKVAVEKSGKNIQKVVKIILHFQKLDKQAEAKNIKICHFLPISPPDFQK